MGNFIEALGKGFERLLRWFYPAGLFLALLYLSMPLSFNNIREIKIVPDPWPLIIVAIVAGMASYLIQAYLVNNIVSLCYSPSGLLYKNKEELNGKLTKWFVEWAERWGETAWRRHGINNINRREREHLQNWLDYSWSTYHATFITV
jgi:hypothetical protein